MDKSVRMCKIYNVEIPFKKYKTLCSNCWKKQNNITNIAVRKNKYSFINDD